MIKYRVPATSANLGVGFDCLGLAIDIYNYFEIEKSKEFIFEGFMPCTNEDNLFYIAYKKTCEHFHKDEIPLHVKLNAKIPGSRGLGSSSALIVGGIFAYYLIYKLEIDKKTIQSLAAAIEGHPDNVTPCIYGGLCACQKEYIARFKVSDKWRFYVLIPDYEVKTQDARKVIKKEVALCDAVSNISASIIGIDALVNFNLENIEVLGSDTLHEPYRKALIKDYEPCKKEALSQGAKAFLISGSGSTMLIISDKEICLDYPGIVFKEVKIDQEGIECPTNC